MVALGDCRALHEAAAPTTVAECRMWPRAKQCITARCAGRHVHSAAVDGQGTGGKAPVSYPLFVAAAAPHPPPTGATHA